MQITKSMPSTPVRNVAQNATCVTFTRRTARTWNTLSLLWTEPSPTFAEGSREACPLAGRVESPLRHWAVSVLWLWAAGRVTVDRGAEATKANLQRGRQASPGTHSISVAPGAFPGLSPTAPKAGGGPHEAEPMGKPGLNLVLNAALPEGEAGDPGGARCPGLGSHSTVIFQRRGKPLNTVPVQRRHHAEWGI